MCRDNYTDVQIVNNFVYLSAPWDRISITSDGTERIPVNATVRGNVFITDRDAASADNPFAVLANTTPDHVLNLFVSDNWLCNHNTDNGPAYWAPTNGDPWQIVGFPTSGTVNRLHAEPPQFPRLNGPPLRKAAEVEPHVLAHAVHDRLTAIRLTRTSLRRSTIAPVRSLTAPARWAAIQPGSPHSAAENADATRNDDDGDGYTNLEEWLHGHAAAVENIAADSKLPLLPQEK